MNPGDLVLDCFLGSGTTAVVAQKLGRRWIGCDINNGAIQTTVKRLRGIVVEQIDAARKVSSNGRQKQLLDADDEHADEPLKPAQFGSPLGESTTTTCRFNTTKRSTSPANTSASSGLAPTLSSTAREANRF